MPQTLKDLAKQFDATHDAMCAALLADLARVRAILRAVLPEAVMAELPGLPEAATTLFLDELLQATRSDFVFRYWLREGRLYLLLEHKSHPDRYSPAQMLGYHTSIWRLEAKEARAPLAVIPILLYNGSQPWQRLPDLAELIAGEGAALDLARQHTPAYRPLLVDMKALPLHLLAPNEEARAGWMAMVCGGRRRISRRQLQLVLARLARGEDRDFETQTIWYILTHCGREPEVFETLADTVREVMGKARGEAIMEALEDHPLILRGLERGRDQGRAEGRDQGRAEGKAETLLSQLRLKFGELPADVQAQVAAADVGQLDAWAAAVLTASSLDEALAVKP